MGTIVIDEQYDKCRRMLKESIGHKRYMHSLGVSDTAACLAMKYEYDLRKAALAGLLHDCAKGQKVEEMLETVISENIEISAIERDNPELLHAKAGSIIARKKYGIEDKEILSSIFYHTTGRPDMILLEKIIFIADYIEPNRSGIPWIDKIRNAAFNDIDRAVAISCRNSIEYLKRSSRQIDRITVDTYEFYAAKYGSDLITDTDMSDG